LLFPFFILLVVGFFLCIFSFQSMIECSKSIYTRLKMLSKMSFLFSVIPIFVIFSKFYIHIFMLAITIIILQFNGFYISIYYVQLIYFLILTIALLYVISLITFTILIIIIYFYMFFYLILCILLFL